jgi:hypothetical protein
MHGKLAFGQLSPPESRSNPANFVMSAALDHAVRTGRVRSNPALGLGLPRPKRRDYFYLTHGQVLALLTWHITKIAIAAWFRYAVPLLRCATADGSSRFDCRS